MTIEELCELDLIAVEKQFGEHLPEEIAQCTDEQALLDLIVLIDHRLSELTGSPVPTAQK